MNIKKFILDTIFPIHCLGCHRHDIWLCKNCLAKITLKIEQTCPRCKQIIVPNGETCFSCKPHSVLDGVLVASFYKKNHQKTILARLIHYHKYHFVKDISLSLGKILKKSIFLSTLPLPEIIIPVPLHTRRLRWRGFNQSFLIAQYLGDNLIPNFKIPVIVNALQRKRYTKPQMEIKNRQKRICNIQNAFIFNQREFSSKKIEGKIIFLIDDIITTGSTLLECAKILKKYKAKKVYGIVLARQ
jgi:ComF family protein